MEKQRSVTFAEIDLCAMLMEDILEAKSSSELVFENFLLLRFLSISSDFARYLRMLVHIYYF